MRKFEQFFTNIATVRSVLRGTIAKQVKQAIGDSVNNNRTLTVSQTIRFLETNGQKALANQLRKVNTVLEPRIRNSRQRTDAVDISEFVSTYRQLVMNNKELRRDIGNVLKR